MITNKHLLFAFRLVVGGVFIWAGLLKIFNPLDFAQDIANYRVFPHGISFFLALVLPWIEVISGLLLVLGFFRRSSALLLSFLLVAFIALIMTTILRGIDIDCGCFGSLSRKVNYKLILTDGFLLVLSLNVFFARNSA